MALCTSKFLACAGSCGAEMLVLHCTTSVMETRPLEKASMAL